MKKLKPELTLNEIGHFRFFLGIVFGLVYAILTSLWFLLIDKAFLIVFDLRNRNTITEINLDLSVYNALLTGTLCTSLGFCFTMYFWTSKILYKERTRNLKMRMAHVNSLFQYMMILFVFAKFLTFDTSLKYDGFGIDLKENYGYLPFLLPIFIFLYNWQSIGRVYKSGKILALSGVTVLVFGT